MTEHEEVIARPSNSGAETPRTSRSKHIISTKEKKEIDQKELQSIIIEKINTQRNLKLPARLPDTSVRSDSQENSEASSSRMSKDLDPSINYRVHENDNVPANDQAKLLMELPKEIIEEQKQDMELVKDEFKDEEDIIKIENGHKTYLLGLEGVAALRGVSVTIKRKEFVCIFGTSGGGKTTLLNLIGTIDKPTKGSVYIGGMRIKNSTGDKEMASIRLNKLSFVFQTFNLVSTLSALENVELPMQLKGDKSRSKIRQRAKELLDKVGLQDRINHFPRQLSGGEQQRVTIARALANDPEIMLLDEPTGDLDTKNTDIVMKILTDLNKKGMTLIMVSHDLNLKNYSHRVIRLSDGKVLAEEIIDSQAREKHLKELYERLDHPDQGKLSIREGADYFQSKDSNEADKRCLVERFPVAVSSMTTLRTEGDYKVVRMAMMRRRQKVHG